MSSERKEAFIKALAQFIAGNAAAKSIALELEARRPPAPVVPKWASEWAAVAQASPVRGYATLLEAERQLREFLS